MMKEEREEMEQVKKPEGNSTASNGSSINGGIGGMGGIGIGGGAGVGASGVMPAGGAGLSFFQKLKTTNQEEAKSKLRQGIRGLPI